MVINVQNQSIVTSVNFAQNVNGAKFTYRDSDNYFYNYPDGVVEIISPLQVGLSWNYNFAAINYEELNYLGNPAQVDYLGTFTIVGIEVVHTVLGNFEAFKIVFSEKIDPTWTAPSGIDYSEESGTMWIYPPIGVIKYNSTAVVHYNLYVNLIIGILGIIFLLFKAF